MANRRVFSVLVVVVLSFFTTLPPSQAAAIAEVPLHFTGEANTVQVHLNGEGPFIFLVEAGSEYTFVGDEIFEQLGILESEAEEPEEGSEIRVTSFRMGDMTFEDVTARVIPSKYIKKGSEGPHGILGWGLLSPHLWSLDFPREKMLIDSGRLEESEPGSLKLQFQDSDGPIDSGQVPTIPIHIGDLEIQAEINTAERSGLNLPEELTDKLPLQAPPAMIGRARTLKGEFVIKGASLDVPVEIGEHVLEKPRARLSGLYSRAGLGYALLRNFVITFDHQQGLVRFVRPEGAIDPQQVRAARVAELGGEGRLREAFNQDKGKVRLLMIMSPT